MNTSLDDGVMLVDDEEMNALSLVCCPHLHLPKTKITTKMV